MKQSFETPEKADLCDREFHLCLMEISGNRMLKLFSQVMVLLFRKEYRHKFLNPKAVLISVERHQRILKALIDGKRDELLSLIEEHINVT
jgi:GntR family galactonate operon transcriptional repressor